MKWSDIVAIASEYESALYSDAFNATKYGCDCCGGDSYSPEEWDSMAQYAEEAVETAKNFCQQNGIEYDGIKS